MVDRRLAGHGRGRADRSGIPRAEARRETRRRRRSALARGAARRGRALRDRAAGGEHALRLPRLEEHGGRTGPALLPRERPTRARAVDVLQPRDRARARARSDARDHVRGDGHADRAARRAARVRRGDDAGAARGTRRARRGAAWRRPDQRAERARPRRRRGAGRRGGLSPRRVPVLRRRGREPEGLGRRAPALRTTLGRSARPRGARRARRAGGSGARRSAREAAQRRRSAESEREAPEATEGEEWKQAREHEARPSIEEARRVEALFERARKDKSQALALKAELDRLGLFKRYEDRFLDLFKQAG